MEKQKQATAEINVGDYLERVLNEGGDDERLFYAIVTHIKSNTSVRVIDQDGECDIWSSDFKKVDAAIANKKVIIIPDFTDTYEGVISYIDRTLQVGCQVIPFEKVQQMAALCK